MGLTGLGLSARTAASVFPGVFRAPAYFTELWVGLGLLLFTVLVCLYSLKIFLHGESVKAEFMNPAQLGFCATLPVSATLVAGGLAPYFPGIANVLWWAGALLLCGFQLWGSYRLISGAKRGEIALAQLNPGLMILFIGGIVVPGGGLPLGHAEVSRLLFSISAAAAPFLMGLLVYRAFAAPPLPEPLRPSWFILLTPPSLIYAHGVSFSPEWLFLDNLFFAALALLVGLLAYGRGIFRAPFGPAWWSFTFPLDAIAYAAARHAQSEPSAPWRALAGLALLLATLAVVLVLARSLRNAASRRA